MSRSTNLRRRAIASVIVVAVLIVPVIIDRAIVAFASPIQAQGWTETISMSSLVRSAGSPDDVLNELESYLGSLGKSPPAEFLSEVSVPIDAVDMRIDQKRKVFGFQMPGTANNVLNSLERFWVNDGWSAVPLGELCGATFVKTSGTYRWMLVTCSEIGDVVSVVGRLM